MKYLLCIAFSLFLYTQKSQAENELNFNMGTFYFVIPFDSIRINDTIKLNANTILVRHLLMVKNNEHQKDVYLLSSDTVNIIANKAMPTNNKQAEVQDNYRNKPTTATIKIATQNNVQTDVVQNEAIVSLPLIEVHSDSVAYYMELLRRLGNREDISTMFTGDIEQEEAPVRATGAVNAFDTKIPKPYAVSSNFSNTEKTNYAKLIAGINARKTEFALQYKQSTANSDKSQILKNATYYFIETITGNFINQVEGKILPPPKIINANDVAHNKYFILAILQDFGFNINFGNIQQTTSRTIAKALSNDNSLKYCKNFEELDIYLNKKGRGLYIVAYDQYLAMIRNDGVASYLILADPLHEGKIQYTPLKQSPAFQKYVPYFNVGSLSDNNKLIKDWLMGNRITGQK